MDQIPCPDGYLMDPKAALAPGHHSLNQYLVRVEEAGWQAALKEVNAIRDKSRKLLIWRSLVERLAWHRDNSPNSPHLSPLRGLAERIEHWTLSPSEADLIDILERTAEVTGFAGPYMAVPHLITYVDSHGLSPALSGAIRRFREEVWDKSYIVNQVSLQLFRSRLDMLCWRDEWDELDLARCWSEPIRRDYRSMQGGGRDHWRKLLYSIHGDEGTRPTVRWTEFAKAQIAQIGRDDFRAFVLSWFQPLQSGRSQRLSREGSYLLRSFVWLCEISADPELLPRLPSIGEVEFKPKANGQKVIRAVAEATERPDPTAQLPVPAAPFDSLVTRALASVLTPRSSLLPPDLAARIEVGDGVVYVRGDLDRYQLNVSTRTVTRQSDGQRVEITPGVTPFFAPLPEFGGLTEVFRRILILAEDAKHRGSLEVNDERGT